MNPTLLVGLIVSALASVLFAGCIVLLSGGQTVWLFLQLVGAGCLVVVGLCHVCEALHLLPWMRWGLKGSVGHYLDFWSAAVGLTLFPVRYLFHAITNRHA
jgi:hypothetical protein